MLSRRHAPPPFCSIQIFSEVRTKFYNSYVLRDAVGVGNTPPFAANDGQAGCVAIAR